MRGIWRKVALRPRVMGAAVSAGAVLFHASQAWSAEPAKIDSGDTAWMLTSAALVLMMTAPGLALFYGGLVRSKNVLNLLMQSFIMIALISVQWVLWGYSLAFGPDHAHVVGGLDWLGLRGVGLEPNADYAADHPAPGLHDLPVHVRHHHAGAHHRRVRRAHEVQRLPDLLAPVGDPGLRPAGAHGVGHGRPARQGLGRARLRRRHGRPHQLGHVRAGVRLRHRQAARLRLRAHAAAQPAVRADRRGAALVRLVRLQRRQRARRQRARRRARSSPPTRRRRRRRCRGCSRSGSAAASRPCSAPPAARSRGWSPSRRRRDSSRRCLRSPSAPSPASCATERAT